MPTVMPRDDDAAPQETAGTFGGDGGSKEKSRGMGAGPVGGQKQQVPTTSTGVKERPAVLATTWGGDGMV